MKEVDPSSAEINRDALFPRVNNLEWVRLIFALQVVITHTLNHLDPSLSIPACIANFPGVPAFFFVSGFLIYASYLNAPGTRFLENRFLRLFPALFVVTLGGVVIIFMALGWDIFWIITLFSLFGLCLKLLLDKPIIQSCFAQSV